MQETGVWGQVICHKSIVCEPRIGGKEGADRCRFAGFCGLFFDGCFAAFEEVMRCFYQEIAEAEDRKARGEFVCLFVCLFGGGGVGD